MSDPLDFEAEDLLLNFPPAPTKRKKVTDLDDLLGDYYSKQREIDSIAHKKSKSSKRYSSDDEDDKNEKGNETKLSEIADECEKQINQIFAENEIALWGLKIFGQQKSLPSFGFIELENCKLLQPFRENQLDSDLLSDSGQGAGETFLEGLLMNGWLSQLALISGFVEASIASWTFYQVLYSSNVELQLSACDFWCNILSKNEAVQPSIVLEWIPSYRELKDALDVYGYLSDTSQNAALNSISSSQVPGSEGPPVNISSWIKLLSACFQIRKFHSIFSVSEAEEVLIVIIRLFLSRQLQGISFILTDCMQSILSFFTEDEWAVSCEKVAHDIAYSVPKDLNSLRIVECISGTSNRSKHFRGRMAIYMLGILFEKEVFDGMGILKSLGSVKLKDKDTDFFTLYIYLVLSENWILSDDLGDERSDILSMWTKFLRNCSGNISSTDWRLYASKVRSKASYLLQSTISER
ncbi:hypothetical protein KFK09_009416 [Dendrobium nobile]|uniref:Uncharacterized protein n=1 Tax=Dendrobium nobile TaxID=94219 RepID=A0A8T3BMS0_DENNO|nr:hypothetical protein KFK09_009416 [Dendrobium nobile]